MNYYNEHDPKAAAWLRELIAAGEIPPGEVDERSILDVRPHELTGFIQQHFFAGVGGWPLALRFAGWPDNRPVRTGSCPCQPFSQAGQGLAEKDERHLWPVFRDLITFGEATITFGEQVSSPLGRAWLSGVRLDLEALGYAFGAADLCAASVGSPHPRQRLYWVAYPDDRGASEYSRQQHEERAQFRSRGETRRRNPVEPTSGDGADGMGDADNKGSQGRRRQKLRECTGERPAGKTSAWSDFDVLPFRYGKFRRISGCVEPGAQSLVDGFSDDVDAGWRQSDGSIFPLAKNIKGRAGLLRGAGNAIVPQLAAEFIQAADA